MGAVLPPSVAQAIASDDLAALNDALPPTLSLHAHYLWLNPKTQQLQLRTLLQVAAHHAAVQVLAAMCEAGVDPNVQSPEDGFTALHCACTALEPAASPRAIGLLIKFGARREVPNSAGRTPCELLTLDNPRGEGPSEAADSELTRPEYTTDDFRMHRFKIEVCPRLSEMHDWTSCPFQHPGEKARRRDPRLYRYQGVPCPDFRKGVCKRGDACTFAHGVFECWLHPSRYRTQLCKEGAACKRSVCFCAHSVDQLREPKMLLEDGPCASQPGSPRGPLGLPEDSNETSRSCSPLPANSEGSVQLSASSESVQSFLCGAARCGSGPLPMISAGSSLSSTPVLNNALAAAVQGESLNRTLSHLSLSSEDLQQVPGADALALGRMASFGPLAAGLPSLGGAAAPALMAQVQQAAVLQAAYQQQLALVQGADPAALLAASMRQPLQALPLSMANAGHGFPGAVGPAAFPSCLGM
eukprot:scaffold5.g611.t1